MAAFKHSHSGKTQTLPFYFPFSSSSGHSDLKITTGLFSMVLENVSLSAKTLLQLSLIGEEFQVFILTSKSQNSWSHNDPVLPVHGGLSGLGLVPDECCRPSSFTSLPCAEHNCRQHSVQTMRPLKDAVQLMLACC